MAKLHLHFEGNLPDDLLDQSAVMSMIREHRDSFVDALNEGGFVHEHTVKIMKPRKSRGPRKPRVAAAA